MKRIKKKTFQYGAGYYPYAIYLDSAIKHATITRPMKTPLSSGTTIFVNMKRPVCGGGQYAGVKAHTVSLRHDV